MHDAIDRTHEMTRLWWTSLRLMDDSRSVIVMRTLGFSGLRALPDDECTTMITEKVQAFSDAVLSGTQNLLCGQAPDRTMQAALAPLSHTAQANRRRLSGRTANRLHE